MNSLYDLSPSANQNAQAARNKMTLGEKYREVLDVRMKLTHEQRSELSADYVQRYAERILDDQELSTYKWNRTMHQGVTLTSVVALPWTVINLLSQKYNPEYYKG
jgi:hypothetical protein